MKKNLLSLVLGCAVLFSGTADVSAFSENEKLFIEELKQISDIKLPENFGEICDGKKIICDENGNIIELSLSNISLKEIPKNLSLLENLQELDLSSNQITSINQETLDFLSRFDVSDSAFINVFSDVNLADVNGLAIQFVKNKNIVNGYTDGEFKPEKSITRAEFTKIILLAKYSQEEIDAVKIQYFTDVKNTDWYAKYVNFARSKDVISGYSDGTFNPNAPINFVEASRIIVNTLIAQQKEDKLSNNWYDVYRVALSENGVKIEDELLAKHITRGEMAGLIYELQEFVK